MPVAKFKTIREASSEDSIHKALNIITPLPGKKWKTKTCGLQSAYIILELEEELQITGVDIGNEHSAFIEVMVSNSGCSPNDFVDLLITCSFMTPIESKNSVNTNRVRCFAQEALVKETLKEKWKFLKVICTQPFNKHVQYGLSFVKLHVVDPNVVNEKKVLGSIESEQNKKIVKFVFREESPESESTTLFDRWKLQSNTISRSDLHLDAGKKTESSFEELKQDSSGNKVRNFVTNKQNQIKETIPEVPKLMRNNDSVEFNKNYDTPQFKRERAKDTSSKDLKTVQKKTCFKNTTNTFSIKKTTAVTREYRQFNHLLRGVVLVISGIQNPDRSNIRSKALAMGAKYRPNWEKDSTHLICQFKNTPKYNQVLGKGKIVSREWIENCHKDKKYLPWRRFALDSVEASKEESDEEIFCESLKQENVGAEANRFATSESNASICKNNSDHSSSVDTDDEIQLVAKKYKISDSFEASTDEESYLNQKLIKEINSKSY